MYYNIKIKSKDSEFTLESNNKSITQREMDIYFACIFGASDEFKEKIKQGEPILNQEIQQELKSINEVEQITKPQTNSIQKETFKETQTKKEIKEEAIIPDIKGIEPVETISTVEKPKGIEPVETISTVEKPKEIEPVETNSTVEKPKAITMPPIEETEEFKIIQEEKRNKFQNALQEDIEEILTNAILPEQNAIHNETPINSDEIIHQEIKEVYMKPNELQNNENKPINQEVHFKTQNNTVNESVTFTNEPKQNQINNTEPKTVQFVNENNIKLNNPYLFKNSAIKSIEYVPLNNTPDYDEPFVINQPNEQSEQIQNQNLERLNDIFSNDSKEETEEKTESTNIKDDRPIQTIVEETIAQGAIMPDVEVESIVKDETENITNIEPQAENLKNQDEYKKPLQENKTIQEEIKDISNIEETKVQEPTVAIQEQEIIPQQPKQEIQEQEITLQQFEQQEQRQETVSQQLEQDLQKQEIVPQPFEQQQQQIEQQLQEEIPQTASQQPQNQTVQSDEDIELIDFLSEYMEPAQNTEAENPTNTEQSDIVQQNNENNFIQNQPSIELIDFTNDLNEINNNPTQPIEISEIENQNNWQNNLQTDSNAQKIPQPEASVTLDNYTQMQEFEPVQNIAISTETSDSLKDIQNAVSDFETFLKGVKETNIMQDEFLICAYYIKNMLNQNGFTMKFINSKLFQFCGKIADMAIVDELMTKNYLQLIENDEFKQYSITPEGEEYFNNNFRE